MTTTASPSVQPRHDIPAAPRRHRWLRFVGPVAALLIGGLAVARFLWTGPSPSDSPAASTPTLDGLRARAEATPDSTEAWLAYGTFATRAAVSEADPSYFAVARTALQRAAELSPDSADVLATQAELSLSLHAFADALPLAERAVAANPRHVGALAALIDARVETGDYPRAESTVADLLSVNPGVAAYARVSYIRQLTGDLTGARTAMQQAIEASGPGTGRAAILIYLGDINLELGDIAAAEDAFNRALDDQPSSIAAGMGVARVQIARGQLAEATARLEVLTTQGTEPWAPLLLGELAELSGDAATVERAFGLAEAAFDNLRAAGENTDLETATYEAGRGDVAASTAAAERAFASRPTVFAADALAWAHHLSGRTDEAVTLIERAMSIGSTNPAIRVHAAAIFTAAGDLERARDELAVAFQSTPWLNLPIRPIANDVAADLGVAVPATW